MAITNANKNLDNQIRSIGASVQFHCANDDLACVLTLSRRLASGIDGAVAQEALYRQFLQQVEMHKSKLVDLRCDQGRQSETRTITSNSVGIPNVAGSWRGAAYNADYFMSQSGADVTWSSSTRSETASGSFANGVLTMRWSGVNGSGQASGTVITGSNGVATEIRWTNGNVFSRQ